MELQLVTDFGWRANARGEGRDEDCGLFARGDVLAPVRGWELGGEWQLET